MAKALMNKVKVIPFKVEEVSKGGIILSKTTKKLTEWQCNVGTVVEIGPLAFKGTAENPTDEPQFAVGDKVYFIRHSGIEIPQKDGAPPHRIIRWDDVICQVEDSDELFGF